MTRKHLVRALAILSVAILALALVGCGGKDVDVTINDNGVTTTLSVKDGQTVEQVLAEAQIELGEDDVVDPALDAKVSDSSNTITITRAVAVTIINGSDRIELSVVGSSVADALAAAQVELAEGDMLDVEHSAPLHDGMTITITKPQAPSAPDDASSSGAPSYDDADAAPDAVASDAPAQERQIVSKTPVPNCNDDSHGYYEILYSDGSMECEEY